MKDPTCKACRGACCEMLRLEFNQVEIGDNRRWFKLRTGMVDVQGHGLVLFRDCPALTGQGKCGIYRDRPMACKAQPVGGPECLEAIELLRPAYHAELLEDR